MLKISRLKQSAGHKALHQLVLTRIIVIHTGTELTIEVGKKAKDFYTQFQSKKNQVDFITRVLLKCIQVIAQDALTCTTDCWTRSK